jgi:UDP-N-acetylmuramoylalanine--D-glutamate ligase
MDNIKLNKFKEFIKNKKIAVVGLGRTNLPLIEFLLQFTDSITGFDKAKLGSLPDTILQLLKKGVKFSLGENYLSQIENYDIIFRTPGMRPDNPAFLKAIERGAVITSEMEVFFELCPAKIYGVTGSDGKTTTTTLIYKLLSEEGYNCYLGGNIGRPLIDQLGNINEKDIAVLELSSFQLMNIKSSPQTAVITNITPNHLDVHLSMNEYTESKKNIFMHQNHSKDSLLVLNYDNDITKSFYEEALGKAMFFSRKDNSIDGIVIKDEKIVFKNQNEEVDIVKLSDILLPGDHNIENYMAAIAATLNKVRVDTVKTVAQNFLGVEHRIELVREINGIKVYNDSIASSPTRTIAGLRSFKQKVILMAGGCDKKNDYEELGYVMLDTIKELVLTGQTAPKIRDAFETAKNNTNKGDNINVYNIDTFEEAVKKAFSLANPGDVVIMSPASTSFDLFKNFEERGKYFKEIVMSL